MKVIGIICAALALVFGMAEDIPAMLIALVLMTVALIKWENE